MKFKILKQNFTFYLPCRQAGFLLFTLLIGAFLRFWKLDWGEGYFFHPDEYHIAASVNQLSFPNQMNPHFFSYGSFITYLIYFSQSFISYINISYDKFASAILIGRFYSAFFSTLTIIVVFLISKRLFNNRFYSILATILTVFTPGLIQQTHFATPESILSFFLFLTFFLCLKFLETRKTKIIILASISLGMALGTKITALVFLPILLFLPLLLIKQTKKPLQAIKVEILIVVFLLMTFLIVYPYSILDYREFSHSLKYEAGVARGAPLVFYTRQFIETKPVVFQLTKVFPYALGVGLEILGFMGILSISLILTKAFLKKKLLITNYQLLIILVSFLFYLLPNAFLFAKWTRFMAPALPFFPIFTTFFLSRLKNWKPLGIYWYLLTVLVLVGSILWSFMFFSIYLRQDVRIATTSWINKNLPSNSLILTESGNMLEVPLKGNFQKIPFDFYHLEENSKLQHQLPELLARSDYFIVQSRRIFANHQRLPKLYPKTARFYDLLFSEALGFEEVKEFNSYPKLEFGPPTGGWKLEIPDEVGEETWSVFDHPVIRIYKKVKPFSKENYEALLRI